MGAVVNDVPVARQSRDPARPQAGESLLDAKHRRISLLLQFDFSVLLFKVGYPFLYHLLKLAVLCSTFVFRNISKFIQKLLFNAQRVSAQIVLHFAASVTKY